MENLYYINDCGKKIEVRIPYVPDYNSEEIEEVAGFLSGLKNITKVKVLPYHNYAGSKYDAYWILVVDSVDYWCILRDDFWITTYDRKGRIYILICITIYGIQIFLCGIARTADFDFCIKKL